MNVYLDIDGVLLANTNAAAAYADDFLSLVLNKWPETTYWLTTHQWRGQNTVHKVLDPVLKPATVQLLERVKPSAWDELKTQGIDFKKPFLWFDDDLLPGEKEVLEHFGALDCLRFIDLRSDPYQLLDEIEYLRSLA